MSTEDIIHGNTGTLIGQFQTDGLLSVPSPAVAVRHRFEEFTAGRKPLRTANNTVKGRAVGSKKIDQDDRPAGTITSPFCLNNVGWWLKMLCGAPATTGAGPYTHVFTHGLGVRPTSLLEMALASASASATLRRRFFGAHLNQMSWDPMSDEPTWQGQLMFAQELLPRPSSAFDGTVAFYDYLPAVRHRAQIDDPGNAGVLGIVTSCDIAIDLKTKGYPGANGQRGYASYVIGDTELPGIGGGIAALFQSAGLWTRASANDTNALRIIQATADNAYSLTSLFPSIGFEEEPDWSSTLAGGSKSIGTKWYANDESTDPIIFTLINTVASY